MKEFLEDNLNWHAEYEKRMKYKDSEVMVPVVLLENIEKVLVDYLSTFYIRSVQPKPTDIKVKQQLSKLLVEHDRKLNASSK